MLSFMKECKESKRMAIIEGSSSDNRLAGSLQADTIRGFNGNDTIEGFQGNDRLFGGRNDDYLFGGQGADFLSGDDNFQRRDGDDKGNDVLIGGSGRDTLIAWGDDVLVGGGPNAYNMNFIENLKNDPFQTSVVRDNVQDTFVAINKNEIDYTLTVVDFEQGIDRIDLRAFGVRSASDFEEIQNKGSFFEAITPEVNSAQLVLRVNLNPANLTYII
jgi:Ca2+-binding RTX toxin-like protein